MKLFDYQEEAINIFKQKKKLYLNYEMGLGKTTIGLHCIENFLKDNKEKQVVILCPVGVCRNVWEKEALKWQKDIKFLNFLGKSPAERNKLLEKAKKKNKHVLIFPHNNSHLTSVFQHRINIDFLLIDEASTFKSHKTKQFKTLKEILEYYNPTHRLIMSATPFCENLMNVWSQIFILDHGETLGKNITAFRKKYFLKVQNYNRFEYHILEGSEKEILEKIKPFMLVKRKKDVQMNFDKIYLKEKIIKMEGDIAFYKNYRKFEREKILDLKTEKIHVKTAVALLIKLLQYCQGFVYNEEQKALFIHDYKIQYIKKILKENPKENFIIFYNFKEDLKRLEGNFKESEIFYSNDKEIIDKWNKKKVRILLMHPKSACYGINAQKGGRNVIWYGLTWSLEKFIQSNARVYRQGQKENVNIYYLVIKNTVDELVLEALQKKDLNQKKIINSLQS